MNGVAPRQWRAPTGGDLDAVLALVNEVETADANPWRTTADQLRHDLEALDDPARDLVACFAGTGATLAAGWISPYWGGARKWRAAIMPYVHPGHRDAPVADELMARLENRAREILVGFPGDLPRVIRSWAPATSPALRRLHERHGFAAVRYFSERRRPTADPLPAAPLADGVRVVPWDPDRSEEVRLAHNESFADHWGSEPNSEETWRRVHVEHPDTRNDLSFLAVATDGQIAGYLLSEAYPEDVEVTGLTEAWVATLGVRPAFRRRGIASALLVAAVAAYRDDGFAYASLGVDAGSETGALGLYDRLGFAEFHRTVTYVKGL